MNKLNILFLIFLVLALTSCEHKKAPDSLTAPEIIPIETKAEEETEDENTAVTEYNTAVSLLKNKNDIIQTVEIDITFTDNGNVTKEYSLSYSEFHGLLNDELSAEITTEQIIDNVRIKLNKSYKNNTVTYTFPDEFPDSFTENISRDDFLEKHDPYLRIYKEFYETAEIDTSNSNTILFKNSDSLEKWLPIKDYSVVDAEATVYLDAKGCIEKIEYSANASKATVTADVKAVITYTAE